MAAARLELDRLSPGSESSAETALAAAAAMPLFDPSPVGPIGGRLTRYLAQFIDDGEHPRMGYYPGLTARPWHDPQNFPIVQVLEEEWQTIRREVLALEAAAFQSEVEGMTRAGDWDVFLFYERGRKKRGELFALSDDCPDHRDARHGANARRVDVCVADKTRHAHRAAPGSDQYAAARASGAKGAARRLRAARRQREFATGRKANASSSTIISSISRGITQRSRGSY